MGNRLPVPRRRRRMRGRTNENTLGRASRSFSFMSPRATLCAWFAALLALAAFAAGCHSARPAAIDRALASCVSADTVILGGVDCERLRASPVYRTLPAAVTALLEPLRPATYL